jgi:hypothetical protein
MMRSLRISALVALSGLSFIQCGGDKKKADSPAETMPSAEPPPEDSDGGTTTKAASPSERAVPTAPKPG